MDLSAHYNQFMAQTSERAFRWPWIALIALLIVGVIAYLAITSRLPMKKRSSLADERLGGSGPPWRLQKSGTDASLRGIFSVNGEVAWAAGTGGTILRTVDGGEHWQPCAAVGEDAKTLDFRAVQAWDEKKALVLAAGPGDKSRVYRTTDGCKSWELRLRNTNKAGFWDGISMPNWANPNNPSMPDVDDGILIGDPVNGAFDVYESNAADWIRDDTTCLARDGDAIFAASNSSFVALGFRRYVLGIGGRNGAAVIVTPQVSSPNEVQACQRIALPMAGGSDSSGVFSIALRRDGQGVAVGGDYTKPTESAGTAAWTSDGGMTWRAASTPPHGYRSAVAWDDDLQAWIAVGTNGSDVSTDDGMTWRPLDDGNWNAVSLPFVVGPTGRIGKLVNRE